MASIDVAKEQARSIQAALNGSSSAMQQIGNIESDPIPDRMLAVGLAHAMNAIGELIAIIEEMDKRGRYK